MVLEVGVEPTCPVRGAGFWGHSSDLLELSELLNCSLSAAWRLPTFAELLEASLIGHNRGRVLADSKSPEEPLSELGINRTDASGLL
jgi:hypothetical protein